MRILLIEDDVLCLRAMCRLLSAHDLTLAADLASAETALRDAFMTANPFDVVLSDLHLPDGTAEALVEQLARRRDLHADRLILCSGGPRTPSEERLIVRLAPRFLLKPVTREELAEAVLHVTHQHAPVTKLRFI